MRYKHIRSGIVCELVKRIGGALLCVDCQNRNHWLCYPAEQWEAVDAA